MAFLCLRRFIEYTTIFCNILQNNIKFLCCIEIGKIHYSWKSWLIHWSALSMFVQISSKLTRAVKQNILNLLLTLGLHWWLFVECFFIIFLHISKKIYWYCKTIIHYFYRNRLNYCFFIQNQCQNDNTKHEFLNTSIA